jgi:hypothetical protein
MRQLLTAFLAAGALSVAGTAAEAAQTITPNNSSNPPGTVFSTSTSSSGIISATLGDNGIPAGMFTDIFQFTVPVAGSGSGSLTTSVTAVNFGGAADTDLLSVLINGMMATLVLTDASGTVCTTRGAGTCGANETWSANNVFFAAGSTNTITVNGLSRGAGSYGGNATFIPTAVPEPWTWAMMVLGFGGMGIALRRRRMGLAQVA